MLFIDDKMYKASDTLKLKVLCLYAYVVEECYTKYLKLFAKRHKLKFDDVYHIASDLSGEGYLERGMFDWFEDKPTWRITPRCCLPLYVFMLTEQPTWVEEFRKLLGNIRGENKYLLWVDSVLKHDSRPFPGGGLTMRAIPYLLPAVQDERFFPYLLQLDSDCFCDLVETALVYASEYDYPELLDKVKVLMSEQKNLSAVETVEMDEMLALYRYYAFGEYAGSRKPQTLYGMLLEAAYALYAGKYKESLGYYSAAMKIRNKYAQEKNVLVGMLNSYLLVLAYVKEGSKDSFKKLEQLINKRTLSIHGGLPAFCIGTYFCDPKRKISLELLNVLMGQKQSGKRLLGYLFVCYSGNALKEPLADDILPKQAILRHELSSFLALTQEEKRELTEKMGGKPLLTSIPVKQSWELVLENLLQNEERTEDSADVRLMYLIRYGHEIEIREQKRLKSGAWGAGKVISYSRYADGNMDYMDDTDKKIWQQWSKSRQYNLTIELALPALVGSDRVYTGSFAPFASVTVTQENPYLVLEKKGDRLKFVSNCQPEQKMESYESSTHIILKKDETHFVVFPLLGKKRHVYQQLLEQAYFPLEAEERLKDFFVRMGDQIEVHSTLLESENSLESRDGQDCICLQIHPQGYEFRILLYAKPFPEGRALFVPGQGMGLVVDEKDGVRYQIKRKLKQEKERFDALVYYIEENEGVAFRQNEVVLQLEQMLDLLEYIYPLGDYYHVEWPEGEQLRLKNAVRPEKWNISLKSDGGWFDIEGTVCLEDETVLDMARLLEMMGNSQEKYIRLNEKEFLLLSDNLRKQLARLEAVAVKRNGKMQVASFQAGLMGGDVLDGELTIHCDDTLKRLREKVAESRNLYAEVPAQLKATLRTYQLEGFQWIARLNSWGAGVCLADDMGLGKTLQSIAYFLYVAHKGASLVVAPASVVGNWKKELARFAPTLCVRVLNDCDERKSCIEQAGKRDVILSSYGLLVSENENIVSKKWNVVCLDEAHTIKNRDTKTSASVMRLQAEHRLILTGTPIQNHLGELWNLFQFINPGLLGSYEHFQQKFIQPIEQEHDKQRQLQLNRIVHPFMLRRTKQEVVEELPDKEDITIPVELSEEEMAVYEIIRRRAKQLVENGGEQVNVVALAEITRLRQAACCASLVERAWKGQCSKIQQLLELMTELKRGGNRTLVFSQFTSFFKLICRHLDDAGENYLYLDGSVPVKKREKLVQEFQEGDSPFFLISLKAGGLGLNLTGANYIIHLDPWWNPAIEQQATDRAYRIGQTQKVTAYHLISSHTIEEKIMRLHESKRNLADALLEGAAVSHKLTAQELMDILEQC